MLWQRPTELLGDIGHLAEILERANNRLAERNCLRSLSELDQWPLQVALITAFINKTELLIDTKELQAIWEYRFSKRSRCCLIWGQNWDEEAIAKQYDILKLQSAQRSFEKEQRIDLMLARIELFNTSSDRSPHCFTLRIAWQDAKMRAEIDRIEISIALDPTRFLNLRSIKG